MGVILHRDDFYRPCGKYRLICERASSGSGLNRCDVSFVRMSVLRSLIWHSLIDIPGSQSLNVPYVSIRDTDTPVKHTSEAHSCSHQRSATGHKFHTSAIMMRKQCCDFAQQFDCVGILFMLLTEWARKYVGLEILSLVFFSFFSVHCFFSDMWHATFLA
jgi:hypothetical protein